MGDNIYLSSRALHYVIPSEARDLLSLQGGQASLTGYNRSLALLGMTPDVLRDPRSAERYIQLGALNTMFPTTSVGRPRVFMIAFTSARSVVVSFCHAAVTV